ncbi:MAG: polyphosphate kinase 1 [Burkholderiaceae bacterium]
MISFQQSKTQSRFLTAATAGESHFINRELSLLAFNERVLSLAMDPAVPLLERLRYVCIVSSNLDELFEIRVSGLKAKLKQQPTATEADGSTAEESFNKIAARAQQLVAQQYEVLNNSILPQLAERDVVLHFLADFSAQQREWAHKYFMEEVLPVLTPIGLEPSHPFPRVLNKSLNFIVTLEGDDSYGRSSKLAVLQAPRILSWVTPVPKDISGHRFGFMMLGSIVHNGVGELFPGMTVTGIYQFRVTRNSDLFVDDEEVTDLREALRGELSQRQFGDAVRLEVSDTMPEDVVHRLLSEHQLTEKDCYRVKGPVNLVRMMNIPDLIDMPELKFPAYTPVYPSSFSAQEPFELIAKSDLLVHHPYESFSTVTDFIAAAARDPAVVAISMTIYRTGQTSEIMESLITAARSGKEVTAVVELMARFDEETNISWASRLENVGAHVVFGVVGNKTHAKMCLVVRREKTGLKRYVHLGTGNYHPRTARLYTDFGLFTADPMLCADAHEVFHQLTGLGKARPLRKLWQSPFTLHSQIIKAIRREVGIAKSGGRALVIAKMNSLVEPEVIEALYKASQAGVKVDLIVRGVCMLRPGIKGLSDNIRVRSVIGRFLEHSRIFYFRNNGADDLYLSSADWMDRNFFRRVEIAVPVLNRTLKQRVLREGFRVHLQPSAQAWQMRPDGSYELKRPRGSAGVGTAKHALSSQEQLQELICASPMLKRPQKEKGK